MAAIELTISGVMYHKTDRTMAPVVIIGEATLTGLGVGGGPILPGDKPPSGKPPGIWGGPIDPYPDHGLPPGVGTWPPQRPPHPSHPIVSPPDKPPVDPPTEPPTNPSDPNWDWVWSPAYGWHPAFVAGDKPQPPR